MKSFIDDLKSALTKRNLNEDAIKEIIGDYEEMIRTGLEEGMQEDEILKKFGTVEQIADELAGVEATSDKATEHGRTVKTFSVSDDNYRIDVNLPSENVSYAHGDDDTLVVSANRKLDESDYTIAFEERTLTVRGPKHKGFNFFTLFTSRVNISFTITLPKKATCERLMHKTANGDIRFTGTTMGDARINNVNGDVTLENASFDNLTFNTVNGDFTVDDAKVATLRMHAVNGDVALKTMTIGGACGLETVSGDATLRDVTCGAFTFSAVSGDLELVECYPESFKSKTVSGDVTVQNSREHTIRKHDMKTISGDRHIAE